MKKSCQIQAVILFWALLASFFAWSQGPEANINSLNQAVQEAKLVVSKSYNNASMGNAIAIDGDRAVVAANYDDNLFSNDGTVYVYDFDGNDWIQTHQLSASNGDSSDFFGSDVAIDGDVIMVGAVQHDLSGAVYVFEFDGADWNETQVLQPNSPISTNYIRFGSSIGLSAGRLIVGARSDPEVGGAAYVFEDDGNSWVQTQKLTASNGVIQDNFGWSVDIFGFTAVIGASRTGDGIIRDGSAYVFKLNQNNNTWVETQKLYASDPQDNLYFGDLIEVNANHLLVGSRDASNGFSAGAVYYFAYDGMNDEWTFTQKITGSDTTGGDNFSHGMSLNGNTVAIGAFQDGDFGVVNSAGSVFIFEFQDPNWVEVQKIMPAELAYQDGFGISVAIDEVNERLFIGATGDDDVANGSGAAFVYDLNVATWEQSQKLLAVDAAVNDDFATAVDIDGTTAVVGASSDPDLAINSGAVYVFNYDGSQWNLTQKLFPNDPSSSNFFGTDVSIKGDWLAISAHVPDGGFVYLFKNNAGTWQEEVKFTASDNEDGDFFGRSIDLDDTRLIVGASFDDEVANNSGSAYIFDLNNSVWSETQKLTPDDGALNDNFGHAVSVHGDRVVVGAFFADVSFDEEGAAYVFELDNGLWSQTARLMPPDPYEDGFFGIDVVTQNDWVMVGASGDDEQNFSAGAVYVYQLNNGMSSLLQKITPTVGTRFGRFGQDLSLDGFRLAVGSTGNDTGGNNTGSVFSYEFNGVNWSFDQELTASDAAADDLYGVAVGLSGNRVIAGASKDDNNWVDDGAAYITNIANRYDLIVNITGLFEGNFNGSSHLSPNRVTFTHAGDSVEFIGGQTTQQVISNIADDEPYDLGFSGDPVFPDQSCEYTTMNSSGVINGSDVIVEMTCIMLQYDLSFNGFYLEPGTTALVSNDITGEQIEVIAGNVLTTFPTAIDDGAIVQLSIDQQPTNPSQTCALFNNGIQRMHGDTTVWLDCEIDQFTIGGTLTGLLAGNQIRLQNNSTDELIITENGAFEFALALDDLSAFNVEITSQPIGGPIQTCTLNNEQGSLNGEAVTNIAVDCPMGSDFIFGNGFEPLNSD